MIKLGSTMGVNFSNSFQSTPIDPKKAAAQVAGLPVRCAKTFSHEGDDLVFMSAARENKLTLAVGCTNDELEALSIGYTESLTQAIKPIADVVSLICVGNEPLGSWQPAKYKNCLAKAVENVRLALGNAGLDIGVTVPQNFEFMQTSYPPSQGAIKPGLVEVIKETCNTMRATKAPFMVNIYPFLTRRDNRRDVPLPYCLFNAGPEYWVKDGPCTYKNIFDAMIDALYVALGKIGYGDLEIVVGECGWPTDGDPDANVKNAQTFNQLLINHCKNGQGPPRYQTRPIHCFVFEMYDENRKDTGPGPFEHFWGVRDSAGGLKYPLSW